MTTLLAVRYLVRASAGTIVGLAVLDTATAAWVAWYLVDAAWSAAPLSASRTPLPTATFHGAWIATLVVLLMAAPCVGVRSARGAWEGTDPTAALPLRRGTRLLSAWAGSVTILGAAALAPLPVYLALFDMGAFGGAGWPAPLIGHLLVIAVVPLSGIAAVLGRQGRHA